VLKLGPGESRVTAHCAAAVRDSQYRLGERCEVDVARALAWVPVGLDPRQRTPREDRLDAGRHRARVPTP